MLSNAAGDTEVTRSRHAYAIFGNFARLSLVFLHTPSPIRGRAAIRLALTKNLYRRRDAKTFCSTYHEKVSEAEDAVEELANSADLARFFGRDSTNDFLMPLMITCLTQSA